MKGDGDIKKIKLIFSGVGINNLYQANVKIYDENNKLIFNGQTYNGKLEIYLKENKLYKVESEFINEKIFKCIYVFNTYTYVFYFKNSVLENRTITLLLTDYYYNLPVEKGEIILWQK